MTDFTVTTIADNIAHQRLAHPGHVIGTTEVPAVGSFLAKIWMYHALHEATANTNPGAFYVQTRGEAVNDQWANVAVFTTSNGTSATSALTATEAIGVTELAITSSASFAPGDYIYVDDATGDTDDEWHTIVGIDLNATDLTIAEGLVAAKASGDDAWPLAQMFYHSLDLAGVLQWRVVYIHRGGTGANVALWVRFVEVTDIE